MTGSPAASAAAIVPSGQPMAERRRIGAGPRPAGTAGAAAPHGTSHDSATGWPDADRADAVADRLHDARAFVAHDHRRGPRPLAVADVQVGMTDARREQPDADLAGPRVGERQRLDRDRLAEGAEHGGSRSSVTSRPPAAAPPAARAVGDVGRPPHRRVDERAATSVGGIDPGQPGVDRLARDDHRDRAADRPQVADRRVDAPRRPAGRRSRRRRASRAASRNIRSLMTRDSAAMAPRPSPGNTNTLLAWPTSRRRPSTSTASNGEPVATIARPSVQRRTSAGIASAAEVGFDSGSTIGRSVPAGHRPEHGLVEHARRPRSCRPARSAGRARSSRPARESGLEAVARERLGRQRQLALRGIEIVASGVDEPARIDQRRAPASGGLGHPGIEHRQPEQPGDADPGGARAGQHDPGRRRGPCPARAGRRARPPTTTAAVPWMSSLNDGTRSR